MSRCFMEGNEAIAWGAADAGCRFFAGYPITPATTIYNTMLQILPPMGGVCVQGEDEIASIGFCLGASMAGMKTLTATSGPGISLYSEQLSFAIGSEIPLVVVDVQRLGPSTGSATRGADGDIQFLRWNSSGGQPVIALCPTDVADCYSLTRHAFNLAETYRCPVFVATNKEIAMTRESVDLSAMEKPAPVERKMADGCEGFLPFGVRPGQLVPDFLPIGADCPVRQTSSTHGPDGYITASPVLIQQSQDRLFDKLMTTVDDFTFYDMIPAEGAKSLLITYGVTARAARAAATELAAEGLAVSLLILKTLWPVPEKRILAAAAEYERVLMVEMNMGQYIHEIRRTLSGRNVEFFGRMDGNLIPPRDIADFIRSSHNFTPDNQPPENPPEVRS